MDNLYIRNGLGPHAAFIKRQLPGWIKHSHVADLKRLAPGLWQGQVSAAEPPQWFTNAPSWLRQDSPDRQRPDRFCGLIRRLSP